MVICDIIVGELLGLVGFLTSLYAMEIFVGDVGREFEVFLEFVSARGRGGVTGIRRTSAGPPFT